MMRTKVRTSRFLKELQGIKQRKTFRLWRMNHLSKRFINKRRWRSRKEEGGVAEEERPSRSKEEITKAIINMYMRLRADGYVVTQLHSDLGAEFKSKALEGWCQSRTILHTYTLGISPK